MLLKINAKARFELTVFATITSDSWFWLNTYFISGASLQLGGMNSFLTTELSPTLPQISKVPTIIIGMDVSHGSPGRADAPSIAAVVKDYCSFYSLLISLGLRLSLTLWIWDRQVVSSRQWPFISRYRAAVCTQSPKLEMIDSLYKKVSDTVDEGLFR